MLTKCTKNYAEFVVRKLREMAERYVIVIISLITASELGRPVFCSSFLVTIGLSRLVSEIFACYTSKDRQTDIADHYYKTV